MVRALLVIEVPFYREGLASLLGQSAGVTVVGAVADARSALQVMARSAPDVVLLDISAADARQTLLSLRDGERPPHVVALAVGDAPETILEWAEAGVIGYVSRSASLADLLQCLQFAVRGETYCSPRVMSIILHRFAALAARPAASAARGGDLTAREREILELIGHGLSNKIIAARLHISHATAKNHVHHILDKLQLRSRAQVAAYLHAQTGRAPASARIRTE